MSANAASGLSRLNFVNFFQQSEDKRSF